MNIECIPTGMYEANCLFLWNDPNQVWVVDPGADGDALVKALRKRKLTPCLVLLTHGHFDHIGAVNEIVKAYPGIPVYLSALDAEFAFSPVNQTYGYPPTERPATLDTSFGDGDTLSAGGLSARILQTPGHTPGSRCFYFKANKVLVTGDTLFCGSCGRTDFPGGSWKEMGESLKRLRQLPDDTVVWCGHGPDTTIAQEKQGNPYFRE